jgi:hypothetical protein
VNEIYEFASTDILNPSGRQCILKIITLKPPWSISVTVILPAAVNRRKPRRDRRVPKQTRQKEEKRGVVQQESKKMDLGEVKMCIKR